jgi:hypothetical protein
MRTLRQGREQPAVWWRIAFLIFGGLALLCSLAIPDPGEAEVSAAIFALGIYSLARTKRFRWQWVAVISFGTLVIAAAILLATVMAFFIWATNKMAG